MLDERVQADICEAVTRAAGAAGIAVGDGSSSAARNTAHSAVSGAVASVSTHEESDMVMEAVQRLRATLSSDALTAVLAELVGFALRDDRFDAMEARYLSGITRAWDAEPDDRLWSVLGSAGTAGTSWTPIHDLAMVYLHVAHASDGVLAREEIEAIARKLGEWLPSALPADVLNVVDEALHRYANGEMHDLLEQSVDRIIEAVPEHQRPMVIRDLLHVAEADHVVLVEEKELIWAIAGRWGLSLA